MLEHNSYERHILEATLHVIAKHSISGTRMQLIAEEAGMTASNLIYHFKTKRDLLIALLYDIQESYEKERHQYLDESKDTLDSKLHAFCEQKKHSILNTPEKEQVQFDFWILSQSDAEVSQIFRQSYTLWNGHIIAIIQKYLPEIPLAHADMAAHHLIAMMMGGSMQYLNGDKFDIDAYFQNGLWMVTTYLHSSLHNSM